MSAHIVTLLPHVQCFGGVRRFIELGNCITDLGHDYTIVAGNPEFTNWMECKFPIVDNDHAPKGTHVWSAFGISRYMEFTFDPRFTGDRWMWIVASSEAYTRAYKMALKKYPWKGALANNQKFEKVYRGSTPEVQIVESGINLDRFPMKTLRVGYYAAKSRSHKNTDLIERKLSGQDHVKLVPIYGLKDKELSRAYRSLDYFVVWEDHGGWSGTASEALASGVQVVTNGMNCDPFIDHVIVVKDLRQYFVNLGSRMDKFSWKSAAKKVVDIMGI